MSDVGARAASPITPPPQPPVAMATNMSPFTCAHPHLGSNKVDAERKRMNVCAYGDVNLQRENDGDHCVEQKSKTSMMIVECSRMHVWRCSEVSMPPFNVDCIVAWFISCVPFIALYILQPMHR
jgi:hypothetical protein